MQYLVERCTKLLRSILLRSTKNGITAANGNTAINYCILCWTNNLWNERHCVRRMCKLVQIRNRITTSDQVLDAFGESYIHSRQLKLNSTPIFRVHKNNERIKKLQRCQNIYPDDQFFLHLVSSGIKYLHKYVNLAQVRSWPPECHHAVKPLQLIRVTSNIY